jgi:hypothetical protein
MNKNKSTEVSRNPPDEVALVVKFGMKLRLSRWGIGIIAVALCVIAALLMIWMTPEQANEILTTIFSRL